MTAFDSKSWAGRSETHRQIICDNFLKLSTSDVCQTSTDGAFRNNVTRLETRHKTPLDWRAAEIMWGTDEKARSQMARRKKWGHVTERSCSRRLPTVKYSNGLMPKNLCTSFTIYKQSNLYRLRKNMASASKNPLLAAGAPRWKTRTTLALAWRQEIHVTWMGRTQQGHAILAFSGVFFLPPERPHPPSASVFWTIRPTTHKKRLHPDEPTCWCGDRKQVKTAPSQENHFCVSPQPRILHFQVFFCNLDWHFYDFIFS